MCHVQVFGVYKGAEVILKYMNGPGVAIGCHMRALVTCDCTKHVEGVGREVLFAT